MANIFFTISPRIYATGQYELRKQYKEWIKEVRKTDKGTYALIEGTWKVRSGAENAAKDLSQRTPFQWEACESETIGWM